MNISFLYIFFILIFSFSKAKGEGVDCASEKSVDKFKRQTEIFYKGKEYESIKKLSLCYLEKFKSINYIYESYLTSLYFTNDTNLLKIFLRDSLLNKGAIDKMVVYLTNDNPLIIDLMDEQNFRRMLDNIFKEYFNNKPLAKEKYFIYIAMIEDQAIRAKFLLKRQIYLAELDSINKIKIKEAAIKEFEELNKINNNKVYQFYKKHKRLFSQNEVNSAYIYQLLLFAHETKSERRLFFQSLLESAVEKGACTKEHLWNFLIRTKQIELSSEEFKNELPNIIEKLRNKYNIPEDFEYNGFLN